MTQPLVGPPEPVNITSFTTVTSYLRSLRLSIFNIWSGKLNCVGEITLTNGATTTVLNRKGLSPQSAVFFDPKTSAAAGELAAGTMYVLTADRLNDVWTITHANAGTTRTFQYAVIG